MIKMVIFMNERYKEFRKYFLKKKEKGELWRINYSEVGKEFGVSRTTVKNYFYTYLVNEENYKEENLNHFVPIKKIKKKEKK